MEQDSILKLMVAHHALLNAQFMLFRDSIKEKSPKVADFLSELKWETKKHFFVEENVIFKSEDIATEGFSATVNHLEEEHKEMLAKLDEFGADLASVASEALEDFHKILEKHRYVEEHDLYPKLDTNMPADEKERIVKRINEVPISREVR